MNRLPEAFLERMKRILGDEFSAFVQSYDLPRKSGLRVNTLKIDPERFERIAPFRLSAIPWVREGFFVDQRDAVSRHPYYDAGLYYLQEPSAMTPAAVLDVRPGMKVLDLCAAPGGKATALGAKLKGEGLLVANDISASRCRALLRNIELAGITNAYVTNEVPSRLAERFPEAFDRVLLDAPCSGEGMFRKEEAVIRAWTPEKNAQCAQIQKDVIVTAASMLRPGGQMVYSTCTFSELENEEVIRHLLENVPEMHICKIPDQEGFACGLGGMNECVRLWPHKIAGEGHFIALLEKEERDGSGFASVSLSTALPDLRFEAENGKTGAGKKNRVEKSRKKKKEDRSFSGGASDSGMSRQEKQILEEFAAGTGIVLPPESLEVRSGQVYRSAVSAREAGGIRFLRNGIYLGELKKNRFEPSQSLALADLCAGENVTRFSLSPEDPRLQSYLRGEPVSLSPGEEVPSGWVLVCADRYALGWGKAAGSQIKNKYPAAWRKSS